MGNVGNTEYQAPEAPKRNCGRDYDVWSLGGVMLEVLVWYFNGIEGVGVPAAADCAEEGTPERTMSLMEFRNKREEERKELEADKDSFQYAGFFILSDREPGGAALVPSVKRVMDEVWRTAIMDLHMEARHSRGLSKLLDVIEEMLVVDRGKRLTARDAKMEAPIFTPKANMCL
ncbi:hypothetical protein QBC45DRAFT_390931 [Copromyces sp. CBS 386.78]|nr:hypothetical protein QBC45DRAFT_390931 [Copromyces sp. CBS 386.78]